MPTRFYLPASGAAAVSPAYGSLWNTTAAASRIKMVAAKSNTALAAVDVAEAVATGNYDVLIRQFVSDPIAAGKISGYVTAVIRSLESNAAADDILNISIRVVSNDGATVRGWLVPCTPYTSLVATVGSINEEFPTASATRIINALPLNVVNATVNDRIVVEIGYRALNTATTSRTGTLTFGDPTATGDSALSSGTTTSEVPWVEFTDNLFTTRGAPLAYPDLNLFRNSDFTDDNLNTYWQGMQQGVVAFPTSGVDGGKCLRLSTPNAASPYAANRGAMLVPISPEMIGLWLTAYAEYKWDSGNTPHTLTRLNVLFLDENLATTQQFVGTPFTPSSSEWTRTQQNDNQIPTNSVWAEIRPIMNSCAAGDAILVDRVLAVVGANIVDAGPHPPWALHPDEQVAGFDSSKFFQFL